MFGWLKKLFRKKKIEYPNLLLIQFNPLLEDECVTGSKAKEYVYIVPSEHFSVRWIKPFHPALEKYYPIVYDQTMGENMSPWCYPEDVIEPTMEIESEHARTRMPEEGIIKGEKT